MFFSYLSLIEVKCYKKYIFIRIRIYINLVFNTHVQGVYEVSTSIGISECVSDYYNNINLVKDSYHKLVFPRHEADRKFANNSSQTTESHFTYPKDNDSSFFGQQKNPI